MRGSADQLKNWDLCRHHRHRPVVLASSRSDFLSREYSRLTLPRIFMVITFVCSCQKKGRASKTPGSILGRRQHASKTDMRIIDFVDTGHPALLRMCDKRQRGYRAMGYRLGSDDASDF